jgi:hypothetical protein
MALDVEYVADGRVGGEEALRRSRRLEALHTSFALSQWLMGNLCRVILPATCIVAPRDTKFAERRSVGPELVGHGGGWGDALLLQKFSHQRERRLAISPWLNEYVQDLAFAVYGTPDV